MEDAKKEKLSHNTSIYIIEIKAERDVKNICDSMGYVQEIASYM